MGDGFTDHFPSRTTYRWSRWRYLYSLFTHRPIFDGPLVHWRGNILLHRGWVYAMPVEFELWMTGKVECCDMLTSEGECIVVRPLLLSEVYREGVVYGLIVERTTE